MSSGPNAPFLLAQAQAPFYALDTCCSPQASQRSHEVRASGTPFMGGKALNKMNRVVQLVNGRAKCHTRPVQASLPGHQAPRMPCSGHGLPRSLSHVGTAEISPVPQTSSGPRRAPLTSWAREIQARSAHLHPAVVMSVWLKRQTFLSQGAGGWKSEVRVQRARGRFLGRPPSWSFLVLSSPCGGRERGREGGSRGHLSLLPLLIRAPTHHGSSVLATS